MSAAKHTPGPWEIVGDGELLALVIRSIPGPDDSLDGTVCTIDFDSGDEESVASRRKQADAALIAAAPQLLEALRALTSQVEFMRSMGAITSCSLRSLMELELTTTKANDALATAGAPS